MSQGCFSFLGQCIGIILLAIADFWVLCAPLCAQTPYTLHTAGPDSDGKVAFDLHLPSMQRSDSFSDAVWIFAKYNVAHEVDTVLVEKVQDRSVFFSNARSLPEPGMGVGFLGSDPNAPSLYVVSAHSDHVVLNEVPDWLASSPKTMLLYHKWKHATLDFNEHDFPENWMYKTSLDQNGIMLIPNKTSSAPSSLNNACLKLTPELEKSVQNGEIIVRIFAIPMVSVKEGPFWIGGTGSERGSFHCYPNPQQPFKIESEAPIIMAQKFGKLWGRSKQGDDQIGSEGLLSAAYPKGYESFYCMKYEVTQGQYRDFLNMLLKHQQEQRVLMHWEQGNYIGGFVWDGRHWSQTQEKDLKLPLNRLGIRLIHKPQHSAPMTFACDLTPASDPFIDVNLDNDGAWHAMGQLSWMDLAAYLDWSALRPMTETEFEKAARGPLPPSPNELAHGTSLVLAPQKLINPFYETEHTDSLCNVVCCNPSFIMGMTRVGSTQKEGPRNNSGASYYGAYDMSGNAWERVVSLSHPQGRAYTGEHGDGVLSIQGHANTPFWPGLIQGQVVGADGSAFRGGSWYVGKAFLRISDRVYGNAACVERFSVRGGRGVRSGNSLMQKE